ncbi:hypothetical protein ZIOFF_047417 [Zingiber officinale]|uniref:Retrovirus-related Pol polyprotein from transposon RE1 n=1 Tax=Zingiber officinale TaxID=94328 RepID=A0A8J5KWQ4_ZINOF|nr:hypothetical protein ZIOFF_047417 [Zingiber officinale]
MEKSNSVKNPIIPGVKLTNDEEGSKVNATMYKQLVGSLMYLTVTRPDLMYVVSLISRFMASPTELHLQTAKRCITVLCDNSSTIKLSKNPVMHGRSKHIDVRFNFLRDLTRDGIVELKHCITQDQVADIMTKPLKLDVFLKLRELMGVRVVSQLK